MKIYKNIISLFFIILCFSFTTIKSYAHFNEEFNNSLSNPLDWDVNSNNGTISYSTSDIKLESTYNSDGFPYVASNKQILPDGNYSIEWKFKYLSSNYGTGISITDVLPINRTSIHPNKDNIVMGSWIGGLNKISLNANVCPINNVNCTIYPGAFYISDGSDFSQYNVVKINFIDNKYYFYYNGNLLFESAPTTRKSKYVWFGNPINPTTKFSWSTLSIDYIHISELPDKQLNVPFFSQNDPLWGTDIYDHMSDTINNKGCSLTSMAMLMRYYGIDYIPFSNTELTPKTLNSYLINKVPQSEGLVGNANGYFNDGSISWIALNQIARYFRPNFSLEILDNNLLASSTTSFKTFKEHIDENRPEILWVSGNGDYWDNWETHFIIGKGYSADKAYINDPEDLYTDIPINFPVKRRLAFFDNPNQPNWGQILFHTSKNLALLLQDANGNKFGKDSNGNLYSSIPNASYIEGNNYGGEGDDQNTPVSIYLSKVNSPSDFTLTVSGSNPVNFDLQMQTLNSDNSAYENSVSGTTNDNNKFIIEFKDSSENSIEPIPTPTPTPEPTPEPTPTPTPTPVPTPEPTPTPTITPTPTPTPEPEEYTFYQIRNYINTEYKLGNIRPKGIRQALLEHLSIAERLAYFNLDHLAKLVTVIEIKFIKNLDSKFIKPETADTLILMYKNLKY